MPFRRDSGGGKGKDVKGANIGAQRGARKGAKTQSGLAKKYDRGNDTSTRLGRRGK